MTMHVVYKTEIVNTAYLEWARGDEQKLEYAPQNGDRDTGLMLVGEMIITSRAPFGATSWLHSIRLVGRKIRKNGEPYAVHCEIVIPAGAACGRMRSLFQEYKPDDPPTVTPARTVAPTVGA